VVVAARRAAARGPVTPEVSQPAEPSRLWGMRILVAGATGAIGRQLVPQLVSAGHDVVGMTRGNPDLVRRLGGTPAVADALDPVAVARAVADAEPEVVVHELTALSGSLDMRHIDRAFALTNRLRTEGTDHLLAAARAVGATKFVAQSFTGWPFARIGGPVKSEDDPLDPDPPAALRETLAAIRYLEERVTAANGIVLRYGGFYGPGTSNDLIDTVRRRRLPLVGDGGGVWSFVHIEDAAAATVAAIEHGRPGIYQVVDDEPAPVREWLPALAGTVGAKPPRRLPRMLARLLAGEAATVMMTEVRGASNAKAKRELGWQPRHPSWRSGFAAEGFA
jgi:nucleoside-diphosphate-sugar epimerase